MGLEKRDPTYLCVSGSCSSHWVSMKMGKGMRRTRAVVEVSDELVRALTYSKQGTERTSTRQEKVGIDAQRRSSDVKLHTPQ